MSNQRIFLEFEENLGAVLAKWVPLEKLGATVDFERFLTMLKKVAR